MSFLNPALLGFTAAIAVPILIHLLNRRRFRRVPWAAMRFLKASLERNRRRMQWEDLLLLILRCLVVLLLALALARPALRAATGFLQSGRAAAVIVLDRSGSMSAGDGVHSRFELARQAADAVLDAFPTGSPLAVVLEGIQTDVPIAEPTYDLNLVRKVLREAPPSELGTDHSVGISRALTILAEQTSVRKEIVLITDRQAWGWRRLPEIARALGEVARDTRLRVVQVGEPLDDNLAVTSLSRSAGFASAGEPIRFHAEISNRGSTPVRQVRATLHVDGGPAVDEALMDTLAAGETRRLTFFGRLPNPGFHAVQARLAEDRLPADDRRDLVVRALETVRVLVVDSDPGANSAFFLKNALQPVPPDAAPHYFLQPRVVPAGQLAFIRLADYDAVILADLPTFSPPVLDALVHYVRDGGALLAFAGPHANPAPFNSDGVDRTGLFPAYLRGQLGETNAAASATPAGFTLAPGPYEHPLFSLWNEAGAGSLASVRFQAAWRLEPAAARAALTGAVPAAQVMIRFADGNPAAVEGVVGRGRVLLFASTAGTQWNDLAVRPAFVPLLYRAVALVAERHESQLNVTTGSQVELRMPSELIGRDVVVLTPGKPGRRVTRTVRAGADGAVVPFGGTDLAGEYRVALTVDSPPLTAFAAAMDPHESDLTEITPGVLSEMRHWAQVIDWSPGQDLRAAFERERVGVEVWLPLAIGVLVLGMAETWLAQQFSRSK